jgi:hypothetical protein
MITDKQSDLAKLAQAFFDNLQIDNCEYGAIGVDCKRPFGNSDVESDILEIIGQQPEGDDGHDVCWSSKQREYAETLYRSELIPHLRSRWSSLGKEVKP